MKTLEELAQLKNELTEAYNTVINSDTQYDNATIVYAKKCMDDAVNAFKFAQFNEFMKEEDNGSQTKPLE